MQIGNQVMPTKYYLRLTAGTFRDYLKARDERQVLLIVDIRDGWIVCDDGKSYQEWMLEPAGAYCMDPEQLAL